MMDYQSAERKSGTSAEALNRELKDLDLEKRNREFGDERDELNDIVSRPQKKNRSLSRMARDGGKNEEAFGALRMRLKMM